MKIKLLLLIVCTLGLLYGQSVIVRKGTYRGITISPRESGGDLPPPPPPTDSIGAEWNFTGDPIGGGVGYSDIIDYTTLSNNHTTSFIVTANGSPADTLVAFNALTTANDTIYIMDNVEIDWTGYAQLNMADAGVILCSGRGATLGDTTSWGALLYQQGTSQGGLLFPNADNIRITGLRIRGSHSELEGNMLSTDYVTQPTGAETGIWLQEDDSLEIDNCELWGWGTQPYSLHNTRGSIIHHNYIHHGRHIYHGYAGFTSNQYVEGDSTDVDIYGNWFDHFRESVMPCGGYYAYDTKVLFRYNIFGQHSEYYWIYHHSANSQTETGSAEYFRNTFQKVPQGGRIQSAAASNNLPIRDSCIATNNWSWRGDSATTWGLPFSKTRIQNNHYGASLPDGLSARIPTAVIVSDADSGTVPLTVKFKMTGSSDPDGSLTTAYWWFGDSCQPDNYARLTDMADSVSHAYNQIGTYTVELIVIDDDGCQDITYKTIKVKPASGNFLSFWVKDQYHAAGEYWEHRVYLDNWLVYSKSTKGNGSWEHIIVDITDTLALKDSVTITLRNYCVRDTSSFCWFGMYVDNVHIFGADVINGDFESGTWSGGSSARTDGNWIFSEYSPSTSTYHGFENPGDVLGGYVGYALQRKSAAAIKAGDYIQILQKVDNPNVP